jgi:hypothetical protein
MADLDPNRFAVGRGPVKPGSKPRLVPKADPTRVAQLGLRQRLAQPLARKPARRERLPRAVVAGLLIGAGLLVLASLAPTLPLALCAGAGALLAWAWSGLRLHALLAAARAKPLPIEGLAELETRLAEQGPQLPAAASAELLGLREQLAEVLLHPLHGEDHHWTQALVRSYLPDSLGAWAQVPPSHRATQNADALLAEQLGLLASQLAAVRRRQGAAAAEALLRQQRFLQAKHREGRQDSSL